MVWLSPRGGLCSVAVVGSGILGVCPVGLVFVLMIAMMLLCWVYGLLTFGVLGLVVIVCCIWALGYFVLRFVIFWV